MHDRRPLQVDTSVGRMALAGVALLGMLQVGALCQVVQAASGETSREFTSRYGDSKPLGSLDRMVCCCCTSESICGKQEPAPGPHCDKNCTLISEVQMCGSGADQTPTVAGGVGGRTADTQAEHPVADVDHKGCRLNSDCPDGKRCANGACADANPTSTTLSACRLNSDCEHGTYCRAGTCARDCRADADCPTGQRCDTPNGFCSGGR